MSTCHDDIQFRINSDASRRSILNLGKRWKRQNEMIIINYWFRVQRSGFKGYNRWILHPILIKIWRANHTPLRNADLNPNEDTIILFRPVWVFQPRTVNPEPMNLR